MAYQQAGYLPVLGLQPGYSSMTPYQPTQSTSQALAPFATSHNQHVRPYQNVPRTSDTFAFSHQNEINMVVNLVYNSIEDHSGWEHVYAPLNAVRDMHQVVTIISADDFMLERTAENTAPRHLDLREEQYSVSMDHWQLGFGMNGEQLRSDKGQLEFSIKNSSFISAATRTLKLSVKGAVIAAQNYWGQQYHMSQRYNSIVDADAQNLAMFGALTKSPKGLHMIWSMLPGMLATGPRRPNINMAVVPHKLALQHQWRHEGSTEAFRVGDAVALRNRTANSDDLLQDVLPIPVYIDKEYAPVNAQLDDDRYPIDAFRRTAHLSAYSILEHCDSGPIDPMSGRPTPTVRCVTMPENNFTEYSMRDALLNCARFGEDGTITDFTQNLIDKENDVTKMFQNPAYDRAVFDPWVYEPKLMAGREGDVNLKVCEFFGEVHTMHRPEEFDVAQGKKFKATLNLTEVEQGAIHNLLEVSDYLFEVTANSDAQSLIDESYKAVAKDSADVPLRDAEWGGPYLARKVDQIPYGFGDIFALMSLLKNLDKAIRDEVEITFPLLKSLEYHVIRRAMYKIWAHVKACFPTLAVGNTVTDFRKAATDDQNQMISVMRGLFERVKHPVWRDPKANAAVVVDDTTTFDAIVAAIKKLNGAYGTEVDRDESYPQTAAQLYDSADENALGKFALPFLKKAKTIVGMAMILNHLYRSIRAGKIPKVAEMDAVVTSADAFAASRIGKDVAPAGLEGVNTLLTVHKYAFESDGSMKRPLEDPSKPEDGLVAALYYATDARTGTMPLLGTKDGDSIHAQGRFGSTQSRKVNYKARAPDFGPFGSIDPKAVNEMRQFSSNPDQFIDARRANDIGGMFINALDLVGGGTDSLWLTERQFMSRRALYIGRSLKSDPIARLGAFCFIMSKVTRDACLALLDNGLNVPMNFILAWPFIRVDTLAMMFAEGGLQTARCNYQLTDVTNPEDGIHKMHDWNLTTWIGSANTNPVNQIIIPDVACAGYRSGLNSKFVQPDAKINDETGFRLSDSKYDGCIVMDVPVTFDRKSAISERHNPLPLTGRHDPTRYIGIYSRQEEIFNPSEPHFASWPAYNAWFGFDKINAGAEYSNESYLDLRKNMFVAAAMYLRRTQTWNGITFNLDRGCKGTGHLDDIDPEKQNFRAYLDGTIEFKDSYARFA